MVYIRFQDLVGNITVAPTLSHRTFWMMFETPRKFGMEHRAVDAKLMYVISEVNMSYTIIIYVIYQV